MKTIKFLSSCVLFLFLVDKDKPWGASAVSLKSKFHMTPFMLKHTQQYMLQNQDMQGLSSFVQDQADQNEPESAEVLQAASLDILDKNYIKKKNIKVERPNMEQASLSQNDKNDDKDQKQLEVDLDDNDDEDEQDQEPPEWSKSSKPAKNTHQSQTITKKSEKAAPSLQQKNENSDPPKIKSYIQQVMEEQGVDSEEAEQADQVELQVDVDDGENGPQETKVNSKDEKDQHQKDKSKEIEKNKTEKQEKEQNKTKKKIPEKEKQVQKNDDKKKEKDLKVNQENKNSTIHDKPNNQTKSVVLTPSKTKQVSTEILNIKNSTQQKVEQQVIQNLTSKSILIEKSQTSKNDSLQEIKKSESKINITSLKQSEPQNIKIPIVSIVSNLTSVSPSLSKLNTTTSNQNKNISISQNYTLGQNMQKFKENNEAHKNSTVQKMLLQKTNPMKALAPSANSTKLGKTEKIDCKKIKVDLQVKNVEKLENLNITSKETKSNVTKLTDIELNKAMNEADGVNLQIFRLQQIKKVAENLKELRKKRDSVKQDFDQTYQNLHDYNQKINKYKSAFSQMEIKTGIKIPNIYEKQQIEAQSNFFENAEKEFKVKHELSVQQQKLKQINNQINEKIDRDKRSDFLDHAEHIMKVDEFIANSFKTDEENQKHEKIVQAYSDSLVE